MVGQLGRPAHRVGFQSGTEQRTLTGTAGALQACGAGLGEEPGVLPGITRQVDMRCDAAASRCGTAEAAGLVQLADSADHVVVIALAAAEGGHGNAWFSLARQHFPDVARHHRVRSHLEEDAVAVRDEGVNGGGESNLLAHVGAPVGGVPFGAGHLGSGDRRIQRASGDTRLDDGKRACQVVEYRIHQSAVVGHGDLQPPGEDAGGFQVGVQGVDRLNRTGDRHGLGAVDRGDDDVGVT